MSGFFGLVKWGSKVNKGAKAINKVAPKAGKDLTKKYLQETQTKRNKAKLVQSEMKQEKAYGEGYKSVVKRNEESKKVFKLNDPSRDRNKSSQEIFNKSKGK